ncbi:LytTR family DNA-binding domain-containing protein [Hymenobacter arcticus]
MSLRCLIVDDEPLARHLLTDYVGKVSFLELHAACASPLAALDILRTTPIDLLLLDVHMPELTGLELLRTLPRPPLVILTTAHSQYALHGYEVDAVDYLLKPITFERFLRAVHKAYDRRPTPAAPPPLLLPAEPAFLFLKDGARQHKVFCDDILFIEGLRDYVAVHTRSQKIISLLRLKALVAQLPADRFVRIHHSYIVGLAGIEAIDKDKVQVGGRWLPVSESYRRAFRAFVARYRCTP